ncbi:hypothetical protein ACFQX7_03755 [Luedemannella flava]
MTKVVFLLAPGVHLLDLAGPAQVFHTAAALGAAYGLHYVGERRTCRPRRACRWARAWPGRS